MRRIIDNIKKKAKLKVYNEARQLYLKKSPSLTVFNLKQM